MKYALFAFMALLGMWLHGSVLDMLPVHVDDIWWVVRTSPEIPGWLGRALFDQHFIAYRPVTALSFASQSALFGYRPMTYQAVDLMLFGVLIWQLGRTLALTSRQNLWIGAALLVLAAHPASTNAVLVIARRSYLLAALFGLATLHSALKAETGRQWLRVGLLGALTLGSNEWSLPLLAAIGFLAPPMDRAGLRFRLVYGAPLAVVWTLRTVVMRGEIGGYAGGRVHGIFDVSGGLGHRNPGLWDLTATPTQTVFPGAPVVLVLPLGIALLAVAWRTRDRLARIAVAWLVLSAAVVLFTRTWFPRQGQFLVIACLLMVTPLAASWPRRVSAVALAVLGLGIASGARTAQLQHNAGDRMASEMYRELTHTRPVQLGGGRMGLAIPTPVEVTTSLAVWATLNHPSGMRFEPWAGVVPGQRARRAWIAKGRLAPHMMGVGPAVGWEDTGLPPETLLNQTVGVLGWNSRWTFFPGSGPAVGPEPHRVRVRFASGLIRQRDQHFRPDR